MKLRVVAVEESDDVVQHDVGLLLGVGREEPERVRLVGQHVAQSDGDDLVRREDDDGGDGGRRLREDAGGQGHDRLLGRAAESPAITAYGAGDPAQGFSGKRPRPGPRPGRLVAECWMSTRAWLGLLPHGNPKPQHAVGVVGRQPFGVEGLGEEQLAAERAAARR